MNLNEKVVEKIIDYINVGAGGRLIISKVQGSSNHLSIAKRGDYKSNPLDIKIYSTDEEIAQSSGAYIVCVSFDVVTQDIKDPIMIIAPDKKVSVPKDDLGKYFIEKMGL